MNREFYYLDGNEQKGPYSIDQLKTLNLKSDTLIWEENFETWQPLKDIDEFKGLIKKSPPPPPFTGTNVSLKKDTTIENDTAILDDINVKLWTTLKVIFFSIIAISLAAFIGYSLHNTKKNDLKNQIYSKIDRIFGGKTVIIDGIITQAMGELKETGYKPNSSKNDDQIGLMTEWWEREKLYTIFEATIGGFTAKQLTRQNKDGFDIETFYSGNMGYKKPTRTYVSPSYVESFGGRMKISDGYSYVTPRSPVNECYRQAFNHFTVEDKKSAGAYSPGRYLDITNFPDIRNEYFYMENTFPRNFSSSSNIFSNWEGGGNINNENWVVYFNTNGKHFELTEDFKATREDLIKNVSIGIGSVILILYFLILSMPKFFRNLSLFGKSWRNNDFTNQILYFEHSLFSRNKFIEILDDKVSKGYLRISNSGTTIILSYPNKTLLYKIDKIQNNKLTLVSQKDNRLIDFS